MTIEQLRKMHQARPFQPFDIHLADGRSIPVNHPELLGFSTTGRTIAVGLPDGVIEIVDLLLVTSLKPQPPASGRRGRQRGQAAE
jgi:hypothetical protein